jgi:hypothetical protein
MRKTGVYPCLAHSSSGILMIDNIALVACKVLTGPLLTITTNLRENPISEVFDGPRMQSGGHRAAVPKL